MRDPKIHVNLSALAKALEKQGLQVDSNRLLKDLYNSRLSYLQVKTNRRKQIQRVDISSNVQLFQRVLNMERTRRKHKGIKLHQPGQTGYEELKEICDIADQFVADFDFDQPNGYLEFISTGLDLMEPKYRLSYFKYNQEKIFEKYSLLDIVKKDSNSSEAAAATDKFYQEFVDAYLRHTGRQVLVEADEIFHIVLAKKEAERLGASYKKYIEAQFVELQVIGVAPELGALHGKNARKRWRSFSGDEGVKKSTRAKAADGNDQLYSKLSDKFSTF